MKTLLALSIVATALASQQPPPQPTSVQTKYMEREIGALITWAINVNSSGVRACSGCNWALPAVPPAKDFSPLVPNMAKKWVSAAKSFGAKSLTLAVNHCGGFTMWPTKVSIPRWGRYNYSVAFSGVPDRDILREFVDACNEGGIAPGIYLNLGLNFFLDVGANSNSHSVIPKGRQQICWDPTGFNASLRPGQAKVTLAEYQEIIMEHMQVR
jgi:hypothetical protein